jgi:hypothetical protein
LRGGRLLIATNPKRHDGQECDDQSFGSHSF